MRGLVTKDDPPIFLITDRGGGEITDRGSFLHHPKHAKAVYDKCREIGVPVQADIPAFDLKPAADEPKTMSAFLLSHLLPKSKSESTTVPAGGS
jgi:hypothetical protein